MEPVRRTVSRKSRAAGPGDAQDPKKVHQAARNLGAIVALKDELPAAIEWDPDKMPEAIRRWEGAFDVCKQALELYQNRNPRAALRRARGVRRLAVRSACLRGDPGAGMYRHLRAVSC